MRFFPAPGWQRRQFSSSLTLWRHRACCFFGRRDRPGIQGCGWRQDSATKSYRQSSGRVRGDPEAGSPATAGFRPGGNLMAAQFWLTTNASLPEEVLEESPAVQLPADGQDTELTAALISGMPAIWIASPQVPFTSFPHERLGAAFAGEPAASDAVARRRARH